MDNLDEVFPDESETATAEQPEVQEEIVETPVEETQQEVVEPESSVVEPQESRHVPINALLDERDKRKALEARIAEYEAKQQAAPQREVPDPYDDPQAFAQYQQQLVDERVTGMRFEMSDRFARQQHGDDAVKTATEWAMERAKAEPTFAAQYMQQSDPIGWIVQQHKRDAMLSDIGDNPDDWFEREAAKRGWQKQDAPTPGAVSGVVPRQAQQPAKVPPRSLANAGNAPSDIRHVASGPLAGVDALFP